MRGFVLKQKVAAESIRNKENKRERNIWTTNGIYHSFESGFSQSALQTAIASSFSSNNSFVVISNLLRAKSSMLNP